MATTYLSKNLPANQNSLHKWTYSGWIKRCGLGAETYLFNFYDDDNNRGGLRFNADDTLLYYERVGGSTVVNKTTNRKFRDTAAWYHVMVAVDKSVSSPDTQIYINGVEETSFSTDTDYTQNLSTKINDNDNLYINSYNGSSDIKDQVQTHVHWVSGYKLTPTTFGETDSTSGIWKPKASPSGITYGTNGFFLKFENSAAMGTDSSGNSNTFTVSGTLTQNVDTPSNNFPIISKVMQPFLASNATLSNGNLTSTSNTSDYTILCSMGVNKGKWYWEVKMGNAANTRSVGVVRADQIVTGNSSGFYPGGNGNATNFTSAWNGSTGFVQTNTNGTQTQVTSNVTNLASGDIAGVALDLDNYTLKFYKNGTLDGTATLSAAWIEDFVLPCARADHNQIMHFNFGSGFFGTTAVASANADANGHGAMEYAVPSGYYTLNTKNIKEFG